MLNICVLVNYDNSLGVIDYHLLEFSDLVASKCQSRVAVLALGIDIDLTAQSFCDIWQMLNWRGTEKERFPRDTGERFWKSNGGHFVRDLIESKQQ